MPDGIGDPPLPEVDRGDVAIEAGRKTGMF
jgi:hypothetical protein